MGLLDDAIREHLDLKRRRGADPSEVAREEAEALGPVRRGEVDLAERPAVVEDAGAVSMSSYEHDADEPAPADHHASVGEPTYEPEPADEPELELDQHDHTPPHGDPLADQQTREFSATDLAEATSATQREGDAGEHDELEDTPEFLQETPEHDRLWFEQKPPKDFDF